MRVPDSSLGPRVAKNGNNHRSLRGFLFGEQLTYPPIPRVQSAPVLKQRTWQVSWPLSGTGMMELVLSASGVALTAFMIMHLGLLSSVLLGAQTMNQLASFLERFYLLQGVAPFLVLVLGVHVVLAARKSPTSFRQQLAFLRQARRLGHLDTWTWAIQVISAVGILALASVHLWVVLTDLPIEALKSGARVSGLYIWFYVPFVLLVEAHISMGLYRIAVKWGILRRFRAHLILTAWTAVILGLGFTILAVFYGLGGAQ